MPAKKSLSCPECGVAVGGETGLDPYKHALTCLHVPPGPLRRLKEDYTCRGDEHAQRVLALLAAAEED